MTVTAERAETVPVATTGTLVARRPAGAYHLLTLAAPGVVAGALPGQFVSVEVGARGTLLRRPFAIAGVDRAAGVLDLAVAVVGPGSAWLAQQPVSTTIELTGPLGAGFAAPDRPTRCLLVGGGYGVAALAWLAGRLTNVGHAVELVSGARSAAALYPAAAQIEALTLHEVGSRDLPLTLHEVGSRDLPLTLHEVGSRDLPLTLHEVGSRDLPLTLHEVTEDGSRGRRGLVTDVLVDLLGDDVDRRPGGVRPTMLFACGPMPMLAAVARAAEARGVPCQVAVEEHMGCSVGVCMTCVVPAGRGYLRACIDGPVVDAALIDWERVAGGGR